MPTLDPMTSYIFSADRSPLFSCSALILLVLGLLTFLIGGSGIDTGGIGMSSWMSSKTGLGGGNGDSRLKSERSSRSSGGLDGSWFKTS